MLTAPGPTTSHSAKRSLAPAPGVTAPPADGTSYRFLSDVIMARGLVEPAAMKVSLQASLAGRSLTEILVDNGHLGEDDLARTLAEHHHLDHVDLDVFAVDTDAASSIEPDVARRFGAVPIALLPSGSMVVALHDPNGSTAALEFAQLTGRPIQPAVASRTQVETLIESLRSAHGSFDDTALVVPSALSRLGADATPVAPSPGSEPADEAPWLAARSTSAGGSLPGVAGEPSRGVAGEPSRGVADGELDAARRRAELADERCHAAEERARAAEELTRLAEARARAAEERAQAAEARVDAAARAGDASSAADAATETLLRMLHACEMLEHEALSRGPAAEVLRAVVDAERAQRMQLEAQLRQPAGNVTELAERVAEIERRLSSAAPALEPGPAATAPLRPSGAPPRSLPGGAVKPRIRRGGLFGGRKRAI